MLKVGQRIAKSNITVSKTSRAQTCTQMYLTGMNLQNKTCTSKQNLLRPDYCNTFILILLKDTFFTIFKIFSYD